MNIKTTWSNWEFVPIKLCIATAYILIGAYFHQFFSQYYIPVLVVFIITVSWGLYLWFTKIKKARQQTNHA